MKNEPKPLLKRIAASIYLCLGILCICIGLFLPIKQTPRLNIVFAINDKYSFYSMLMVNSIMRNNTSKSKYTFWILESDVSPKNKKWMADYVEKEWKQELKFVSIDEHYIAKWRKMRRFVPPISMARILVPNFMPANAKKALYLDVDMLVTTDLKELFDMDLGDKHVGMVGNKESKTYVNAGMVLFNLPKWHKTKMVEEMLNYLDSHPEIFVNQKDKKAKTNGFDQALINRALKGKIKFIDKKWNNQNDSGPVGQCIYHFPGPKMRRKPWVHRDNGTPAQNLYIQYYQESSLYGRPEDCIFPPKKP